MFNPDFFRQYRKFDPGEFVLCFVDTAGEGSDWNAGHFLSKDRLDIPLVLHFEGSITDVTPEVMKALNLIKDQTGVNPVVAYETNNGGGYELRRLERLNKYQKYTMYQQYQQQADGEIVRIDKLGWNTNSATRPPMLIDIQDMIKNQLVKIYDPLTVDEMFSFVKHKTPRGWRAEAETGAHDDLIMALAGVWQMYQTEERPATEATANIYIDPFYANQESQWAGL
jgi:hypothetical protein